MAILTENGWEQCSRAECENPVVPGTENVRIEVRAGDVAIVLVAWAAWWHRNVMPIDVFKPRDYWGWSATNDVWNSNHLSGTAIDLNATQLPWQRSVLPQDKVNAINQGLKLFEGVIFWGGAWDRVDQMHAQINGNAARVKEFADKLRGGYLGIWAPADPKDFPLPTGYAYGPLEGPAWCVSGQWQGDSQQAKDGLGRWQEALGLPVTKVWDTETAKAATVLQLLQGWPEAPGLGRGLIFEGEWNMVIKHGWKLPPGGTDVIKEPDPLFVKWGDYSQYQEAHIDGSYPHKDVCFRASIGNDIDTKFFENMRRARELVAQGKLEKVIAYHFWVPGTRNFEVFRSAIDRTGGVFPELAFMIDVEDGGKKWGIKGDQSAGVNDFIRQGQDYFGNDQAASGYLNFRSNASLWLDIPVGLKLIVPGYGKGQDVPPFAPRAIFGHQYTDKENTPPFGPTDMNISKTPRASWLAAWGVNGSKGQPITPAPAEPAPTPEPVPEPIVAPDLAAVVLKQFGA